MAKDIGCILATFQSIGSSREVVKVLGVDRRNVKKATQIRILLDTSGFAFWTVQQWTKRSYIISEEVKELVILWWITKTTMSLNWKDVSRKQIATKTFEEHLTHYLKDMLGFFIFLDCIELKKCVLILVVLSWFKKHILVILVNVVLISGRMC